MESEVRPRKPYPTDVSDEEWAFVAPYLTLDDPKTRRSAAMTCARSSTPCAGSCAPALPGAICRATCRRGRRSISRPSAGSLPAVFEAMVHDLRAMLRWSAGRADQPTAVIFDSATRQTTPESGHRAGYDGHKTAQGQQDPRRRRYLGRVCWCCT